MTRKDYILIARTIREAYDEAYTEDTKAAIALMTSNLASRLNQDNPRFDRNKFFSAALGR